MQNVVKIKINIKNDEVVVVKYKVMLDVKKVIYTICKCVQIVLYVLYDDKYI